MNKLNVEVVFAVSCGEFKVPLGSSAVGLCAESLTCIQSLCFPPGRDQSWLRGWELTTSLACLVTTGREGKVDQ